MKLKAKAYSEVSTKYTERKKCPLSKQNCVTYIRQSVSRMKHTDPVAETSFSITISFRPRIQSLP